MDISFSVENQMIRRTDENEVVADSKNFLRAVFTLSPAWKTDHIITPLFRIKNNTYTPEMKDGRFLDDENACYVPPEALASVGFYVSIFDETDNVRITANESFVRVTKSGYTAAEESLNPSPTVYDEILQAYAELKRKVDDIPQITVDTELSDTSENPVQNKAVKAYVDANPWAKQITYNMEDNHLLIETKSGHIDGKLHASLTVTVVCASYTRNRTEILSVSPLLSDYRGVTVETDLYNSLITKSVLKEEYVDLSETIEIFLEGETMRLHLTDFESSVDSAGAVGFMRTVESDKSAQTSFSDGLVMLKYTYRYLFNEADEALRDSIYDELFGIIKGNLTRFTVRYAEIPYSKTAEVLNNE